MTFKGPFQPKVFYDSILNVTCSSSSEKERKKEKGKEKKRKKKQSKAEKVIFKRTCPLKKFV